MAMYEKTSNNQGKDDILNINIDENDSEEAVILFYELYKNSDVNELPNSYWMSNGKVKAKYIVRHVIENILKYDSREKVIHKLSIKDFKTTKLNNMLTILFDGDLFETINNAYPNRYTKEMFDSPRNYWDIELLKEEVERIAKEKGKPVNKLRLRETAPCLYGGEKIFHRLCGGFDNFIRTYYPENHWWVPRRKGEKRTEYTNEQEKEAIRYVLVEYLGIDITDAKTFHHVTCRDFYENHLRFLCDKYDYDVEKMIYEHFPNLKICNYVLNNYEIISPDGEIFEVNSIRKWVIENRDKFPETVKENTINCALVSTANPNSTLKSYRGWKAIKIINEYNR